MDEKNWSQKALNSSFQVFVVFDLPQTLMVLILFGTLRNLQAPCDLFFPRVLCCCFVALNTPQFLFGVCGNTYQKFQGCVRKRPPCMHRLEQRTGHDPVVDSAQYAAPFTFVKDATDSGSGFIAKMISPCSFCALSFSGMVCRSLLDAK